jgi:hypothetical protein
MSNLLDQLEIYLTNKKIIGSSRLKEKLFTAKIKERKCEQCLHSEWNHQPIPLQLHHKNGDNMDNSLTNLQILCPNCHAQTSNFCGKNTKNLNIINDFDLLNIVQSSTSKEEIMQKVKNLNKHLTFERLHTFLRKQKITLLGDEVSVPRTNLFNSNGIFFSRKVNIPSKDELSAALDKESPESYAKTLQVSPNTIRTWMNKYGIPKKPFGYWNKIHAGYLPEEANKNINKEQKEKKSRKQSLTREQVLIIKELLQQEKHPKEIATITGIGIASIYSIKYGYTYKNVK